MTIRPSGKARKRTTERSVPRQTPEQMYAVWRAEGERHERVRKGWVDNLEASAQRIIDEADKMPAGDVEDAQGIVVRIGLMRAHEEGGRVRNACFEAFQIGRALERIKDSPLVEIARLETENYVNWRGIAVRVTPREGKICRFMEGRTEADLAELYRACWSEPFNRELHCGKVRKALSDLTAKFLANDPCIRVQLSVRGGRVILTEGEG